jgi:hypothetical protein
MGLISPYTRIFRPPPTEGVDSKSEKPRLARRASHADVWRGTCARTRVRSTPLELWRVFSTWRGFPSPGPSPARSSARPPPRRASRTRASPSSRYVPFGVPTFSRRETAESRPPTPVARAAARRATAANARGGARAFDDGVRHRVECLEMALAHPRTPHAARIARARLRSGLGSGCTLRSRDVEDKMRPAPEGPTGSRRRAAVSSTPRSASPKRALHETLAHLDSTAHRSRFPRSSLAAPPVCRRRSGKSRRSTRTATPFAIPCT